MRASARLADVEKTGRRSERARVYATPDEKRMLRAAAARCGLSLAAFLRESALERASDVLPEPRMERLGRLLREPSVFEG